MNQYNSTMYNQTIFIGNTPGGAGNTALVPVTPGVAANPIAQPQMAAIQAQPVMISAANPYAMMYPNMGMLQMAPQSAASPMVMGMNHLLHPQTQASLLVQQPQFQHQKAMEAAAAMNMGLVPQGGLGMNSLMMYHQMQQQQQLQLQQHQQNQMQQQQLQTRNTALHLIAANPQMKKAYETMEKAQQEEVLTMWMAMVSQMQSQQAEEEEDDEDEEEQSPENQMLQMMQAYGLCPPQEEEEEEDEEETENSQQMMLNMMNQFMKKVVAPEKEVFEELEAKLADEELLDKKLRDKQTQVAECSDCSCCKGYPYNCQGSICQELGSCHCYMHREKEEEKKFSEKYFRERENCACCRGYIYGCKNPTCLQNGFCFCSSG
jgi:hypothetical protein